MSVRVLVPNLLKVPLPEMALLTLVTPEWLNANAALFTTAPVPMLPVVLPLPICKVPALTVVAA